MNERLGFGLLWVIYSFTEVGKCELFSVSKCFHNWEDACVIGDISSQEQDFYYSFPSYLHKMFPKHLARKWKYVKIQNLNIFCSFCLNCSFLWAIWWAQLIIYIYIYILGIFFWKSKYEVVNIPVSVCDNTNRTHNFLYDNLCKQSWVT